MKTNTPLLPGIHLVSLRRRPRTKQQRLREEYERLRAKSFDQLGAAFGKFVEKSHLKPTVRGVHSRQRVFSKENTFWAFMGQVLSEDGSCQEVVHKLQSYAAVNQQPLPSSATTAYCRARVRLDKRCLQRVLEDTARSMEQLSDTEPAWCERNVNCS